MHPTPHFLGIPCLIPYERTYVQLAHATLLVFVSTFELSSAGAAPIEDQYCDCIQYTEGWEILQRVGDWMKLETDKRLVEGGAVDLLRVGWAPR